MKKLINIGSIVLCGFVSLGCNATDWELKHDFKYRETAVKSVIEHHDDGSFDKKKLSEKDRFKSETLLSATNDTLWQPLEWVGRVGYKFERKNDIKLQFKQDGSLKKNKSRVEYQRTQLIGLGLIYKMKKLAGSDRWVLKTHADSFYNIDYDASHLGADAKAYSGQGSGYEFKAKLTGEYSTSSHSWYIMPTLDYRHRYAGSFTDKINGKIKSKELDQRFEFGLFVSWIMPIDGFELMFGPMWQRQNEAQQQSDKTWQWQDQERTFAHIKLEYEEPIPGFEMEIEIEHVIGGANLNQTKFTVEFSYEF